LTELRKTPLTNVHRGLGAKMVDFAGYDMPLNYPAGILKEHLHTRSAAGLFDVSHMGQIVVRPRSGKLPDAAAALETLMPMDVVGLPEGRQRYALLTAEDGGILDDLMVANRGDHFLLVVNAACKEDDLAHLEAALGESCTVEMLDNALLALQGPKAAQVLGRHVPDIGLIQFMDVRAVDIHGVRGVLSRSGYTGEDGFEISLRPQEARDVFEWLIEDKDVLPIGLAARDSLRLEAGLCLYGHDIDRTTTPIEAALEWAIQPARRAGGARAGRFPGEEVIFDQIERGAARRRVGLRPEGRAPMREDTEIYVEENGEPVGKITSGGFGPSLDAPVAMGYVPIDSAAPGTRLLGQLRGRMVPVTVARMPFIEPGYKRG
jgi:glycine cleavage system T protein (aminomethyltransferase)